MTVYLVKTYDYEPILWGVFSTEEKARAFITKAELQEAYIEEEEVDINCVTPEPTRFLYELELNKDGTIKRTALTVDESGDDNGCVFPWREYVTVRTWAKDKAEALAKALRVHKYLLVTRGWDTSWRCDNVDVLLRSIKN